MGLNKRKKLISAGLLIIVLFSCFYLRAPQKAEATFSGAAMSVPIYEVGTSPGEFKEGESGMGFGWDTAGYLMAKVALSVITNQIVEWINSGFEGSPTFVQNPGEFLGDVANQASGVFIKQLGLEGVLCSPFRSQIIVALESSRSSSMQKFQCTIEDAVDNWDDFMNDFSSGGWDGWISLTSQPQNNPYGAYLMALDEKNSREAEAKDLAKLETSWGSGFVSLKTCEDGQSQEDFCVDVCDNSAENYGEEDEDWNQCHEECMSDEMGTRELCDLSGGRMQNTTPGRAIADQLSTALGSPFRQLEMADEIEESLSAIFNALINQLVTQGVRSMNSDNKNNWHNKPPTSDEQEDAIKIIDGFLGNETDYKNAKQLSINLYNWAIGSIEDLKKCYEDQIVLLRKQNSGGDADSLQSIIDNKLVPLISSFKIQKQSFETAIQDADYAIGLADDLKNEIRSATTYQEITDLLEKFKNKIQPQLHTAVDVMVAQNEYNMLIKPSLEDIINGKGGIADLYQQCVQDLNSL